MKTMSLKAIAIALASLLVAGCATSPVPYKEAKQVSATNLLAGYALYSKPSATSVRVVVVRDSGMLGAAAPAKLSIDGVEVAKLWSSEGIELHMPPASYIFAVEPSPRLMGALVESSVEIKPQRKYAFRLSLTQGGSFSLQQSTQLE